MSLRRILGLMVVLLLVVPLTAQAGVDFQEDYDDDTAKAPPGDPWYTILTGGVWVETGGAQQSAPHSLMINNAGFNGADRGSEASLGGSYDASDDCPLVLEYYVYYGSSRQQGYADYYVVLSEGGVKPPPPGSPPLPFAIKCVAYCNPFGSGDFAKKRHWVFDGKKWSIAGFPAGDWNLMRMSVRSNDLVLECSSGGGTVTREYAGQLDTISVYTTNFTDRSYTSIDDLSVTGGIGTVTAGLDILPNDDPNYFVPNKKSAGRLPMAVLGSADLDVTTIDFSTVEISGVYPVKDKATYKDVNLDGFLDLELKFSRSALIDALGLDQEDPGNEVEITVSAKAGCDNIEASDVVIIE